MKKVRIKAKSTEEALESGSKILGVPKEGLEAIVISEAKAGVLGIFGGEEGEIEVREKTTAANEAIEILQEILNRIGLLAVAELTEESPDGISLNIKGEELGRVIGKQGATLKAIQLLISTMLSRQFGARVRVYVDAGGYLERQAGALRRLAIEAAKDVAETGQEKELPPMTAAERRIVHMALKDHDKVQTFSRGEGADRRLIIAPK